MAYLSTKCREGTQGKPYWHEDCVTGPDPWAAGDTNRCECPCHEEKRQLIARAKAGGLTTAEIRRLWARKQGIKLGGRS